MQYKSFLIQFYILAILFDITFYQYKNLQYSHHSCKSMLTQMFKKQLKIVCQSQWIMKIANQQILQYANSFGNQVMIYSRHIDYNRNISNYDRNSTAYASYVTADSRFIVIFTKDPHSIHIFDVANGKTLVARGLDDLAYARVIAVAVQPQEEIKQSSHTRKINLLFQHKNGLFFQVIQIQPTVDSNPKFRIKTIEQATNLQNPGLKVDPVFSAMVWNHFILCRKQTLRVLKAAKKNQDLSLSFALQSFEPKLNQLFTSLNVLGMAQSLQTWAILCGNNHKARDDEKMTINIFWQHFQGNQLGKCMYYKDSSFIKNIQLPSTQRDFVKFWFCNGCYMIQVRGHNDHQLHIVPQKLQASLVSLKLIQNSQLCRYSLNINNTQVSVCEVVNQVQLYRTKLYEKQINNQQTNNTNIVNTTPTNQQINNTNNIKPTNSINFNINSIASTNATPKISQRNTSNQIDDKNKNNIPIKKQVQTSIKVFTTANEKDNSNKQIAQAQVTKPQNKQQSKNTVKKVDNPFSTQKRVEQPKPIINQMIAAHFDKNDKPETYSITSQEIEAPDSLKNLVSFGMPNQIKPKPLPAASNISFGAPNQPKNNVAPKDNKQVTPAAVGAISFGTPNIKPPLSTSRTSLSQESQTNKQKININIKQPKKQIPTVSKTQAKQITQMLNSLINKIYHQLQFRQNQFTNNYKFIATNEKVVFQPLFNKQQQSIITSTYILIANCQLIFQNKQRQSLTKNNSNIMTSKQNIVKTMEKCQQLLNKLEVNIYEGTSQLKSLRKIAVKRPSQKSFQTKLTKNVQQIKESFDQIEKKINYFHQKTKNQLYQQRIKKQKPKKKLNLKEFTIGLKNLQQFAQPEPRRNMKVPMLRRKYIQQKNETPFLKLVSLKET